MVQLNRKIIIKINIKIQTKILKSTIEHDIMEMKTVLLRKKALIK